MKTVTSLAAIRWKTFTEHFGLWLAQILVFTFRAMFRVSELFATPERKLRLRRLREKMENIEQDQQQILSQIRAGDVRGGLEAVDAMEMRHANPEDQEEIQKRWSPLQKMRQESDAMQIIARQAGDNKNRAVEGYRDYVKENPDSSSGYSYLGGFLKQTGDIDGSLAAYREVLRLTVENSLPSSNARMHIGEIYLENGDVQAAIREFQHIIDHASRDTQVTVCYAYYLMGEAHQKLGDKGKAKEDWKKASQWDTSKIIAKKAQEKIRDCIERSLRR